MPSRPSLPTWRAFAVGLAVFPASLASAQQPLTEFLAAADEHALDVRDAEAARAQAASARRTARARLSPVVSADLAYTRNQTSAPFLLPGTTPPQTVNFLRLNQLDALFAVRVPLLDAAAWLGSRAADSSLDAAESSLALARRSVAEGVVVAYHELVATRAVVAAAERALATAEESATVATSRADAGLASEVERQRARADVERARQRLADAHLQATLAARDLEILSGLTPSAEPITLADDLHAEAPLESFAGDAAEHPSVRAAADARRAAEDQRASARAATLPTISASATERGTNASGFTPTWLWAVGLQLQLQLDAARVTNAAARDADVAAAAVREERAQIEAERAIFEAWHRVTALLAGARAADATLEASRAAANDAHARYGAGLGTQLEVSQAERDLFEAEVERIRAFGGLAVARLALRLRSGRPFDAAEAQVRP